MPRVYSAGLGNCPGDPTCPGYVEPGSPDYIRSLQDEVASLYDAATTAATTTTAAPKESLDQWIKAHQTAVLTAAAGLFLLAMFGGISGRR